MNPLPQPANRVPFPANLCSVCKRFPPDFTEPWTTYLWRPIQISIYQFMAWLLFTNFYRRRFRIDLERKEEKGVEVDVDVGASM